MDHDDFEDLLERYEDEANDRLEHKLGGRHEWDNAEPA
jgi:hypothetical protein